MEGKVNGSVCLLLTKRNPTQQQHTDWIENVVDSVLDGQADISRLLVSQRIVSVRHEPGARLRHVALGHVEQMTKLLIGQMAIGHHEQFADEEEKDV